MPPTTAGDVLDERVTAFEATTAVGDAVEAIRTSASGSELTVYYAYVIEDDGTLRGVVSMRELLNADDEAAVSSVATESLRVVTASDPLDSVAEAFARYKFAALPVVDESGELLGIVRSSDVLGALDGETSEEALSEARRDIEYDPAEESPYECFECGTIVTAAHDPGRCPNCGSDVRHRKTPIE